MKENNRSMNLEYGYITVNDQYYVCRKVDFWEYNQYYQNDTRLLKLKKANGSIQYWLTLDDKPFPSKEELSTFVTTKLHSLICDIQLGET